MFFYKNNISRIFILPFFLSFFIFLSLTMPNLAIGQSVSNPKLTVGCSTTLVYLGGSFNIDVIGENTTGLNCQGIILTTSLEKNLASKNNISVIRSNILTQIKEDNTSDKVMAIGNATSWLSGATDYFTLSVKPKQIGTIHIDSSVVCIPSNGGAALSAKGRSWTIDVVNPPLSCTDKCSTGQRQCLGDGYQTCTDNNNDGCLEWGLFEPCGNNEKCQGSGNCTVVVSQPQLPSNPIPVCSNQCAAGLGRCDGNSYQNCIYDGLCYKWGPMYPCINNQICQGNGLCTSVYQSPSCVNQCSAGLRRCNGNGYQVCNNNGSCNVWSLVNACGANQTCQDGNCVTSFAPPAPVNPPVVNTANGSMPVPVQDIAVPTSSINNNSNASVNKPPYFTGSNAGTTSWPAGGMVEASFTAYDFDGDKLSFTVETGPSNRTIYTNGNKLTVKWTASGIGNYTQMVKVCVTDGIAGHTQCKTWGVNILARPQQTPNPQKTSYVGSVNSTTPVMPGAVKPLTANELAAIDASIRANEIIDKGLNDLKNNIGTIAVIGGGTVLFCLATEGGCLIVAVAGTSYSLPFIANDTKIVFTKSDIYSRSVTEDEWDRAAFNLPVGILTTIGGASGMKSMLNAKYGVEDAAALIKTVTRATGEASTAVKTEIQTAITNTKISELIEEITATQKVLRGTADPDILEATLKGKRMHNDYIPFGTPDGFNIIKEDRLGNYGIADALKIDRTTQTGYIYELKPNNVRAISKGQKQLGNYLQGAKIKYPEIKNWITKVETYR